MYNIHNLPDDCAFEQRYELIRTETLEIICVQTPSEALLSIEASTKHSSMA